MDLPVVLVLRDRQVEGINHLGAHDGGRENGLALPVDVACLTEWETDAHCQPIFPSNLDAQLLEEGYPRINGPALPAIRKNGADLLMGSFWYDIDNSPHEPHTDETFESIILMVDEMANHLRPSYWFTTRKGARFIYLLDKPLPVDEAERAHRGWAEVLRLAGVPIDPKCHSNWTRVYRLPKVVRDGEQTSNDPFFRFFELDTKPLRSSEIPRRGVSVSVSAVAAVEGWDGPMPSPEDVVKMCRHGDKDSDFWKQARAVLRHLGCGPIIFESAPLAGAGQRDDQLFGLVKQAFRALRSSKIKELATPPRVFALFYKPVEQLEPDRDTPNWIASLWQKCVREWRQCLGQEEAARQEEEKQAEGVSVTPGLLDHLAEVYKLPHDEFGATLWAQQHTIAVTSDGHYYLLQDDGSYTPSACSATQIIPTMRALGIERRIETHRMATSGVPTRKDHRELVEDYATAVFSVEMSLHCDKSYIEDVDSSRAKLVLPAFKLRDWDGVFDPHVDRWLHHLAGANYKLLENWIVRALAFRDGAICALILTGPPSVGKKVFVRGLSECIDTEALATGLDFERYQTDALLQTCFLSFDEEVPDVDQLSGIFRRYVGGEQININRKYQPIVSIRNPVRIITTCNYSDIVHMFSGKRQLEEQDQEALALRMLHVPAKQDAADYLAELGGLEFTAKPGARWVRGDAGQHSDYVVAKHFLWLYQNRPRNQLGKRLLMEGNVQEMLMREMRTRSGVAPEVLETIAWMIEASEPNIPIAIDEWGAWVTAKAICDVYQGQLRNRSARLNTKNVSKCLDGICYPHLKNPVWKQMKNGQFLKGRWRLVKAHDLLDYAYDVGLMSNKLQAICNQAKES